MRRRLRRIPVVLAMLAVLLTGTCIESEASGELMPKPEEGRLGSLTVCISRTDDEKVTCIGGAELTVYCVASLLVKNGSAEYTLKPDYADMEIDFDGMKASESQEAAEKLAARVRELEAAGKTQVTGADGRAVFKELEQGMYLVVQRGSSGEAEKYEPISPFLIAVPLAEKLEEGNRWSYHVEADPKTEVVKKPVPQPEPEKVPEPEPAPDVPVSVSSAKTGDDTLLVEELMLAFVSGALICVLAKNIRKQKNADR